MNIAARELAWIGAAKAREHTLAVARQMRAANGQPPHSGLEPVLVLSLGDRL